MALALLASCGPASQAIEYPVETASLPSEQRFLAEIDRTMGVRDCFLPLVDPRFVPAAAAPRMKADERVLGLDLGGEQFAYPIQYLNLHEIVEHTAQGQELLVCW